MYGSFQRETSLSISGNNEESLHSTGKKTYKNGNSLSSSKAPAPHSTLSFDGGYDPEDVLVDGHAKCSPAELRELMRLRGTEARDRVIADYGGVRQLCQRLCTHPDNGIGGNPDDIRHRREVYGSNEIKQKPMKNFLFFVWEAWWDMTLVILTVSAVVSLLLSLYQPTSSLDAEEALAVADPTAGVEWIDGVAILIAVVVVVLVTASNDYSKEVQFRGLKRTVDDQSLYSVDRRSEMIQLCIKEIVVGDICRVKYGDVLPADGFLIYGTDVRVDESSLTGESDLVRKSTSTDPVLLSGTYIMEGSGKMVVTAVGINSQAGQIMKLLGATSESTRCCAEICSKKDKDGDDDDDDDDDTAKSVLRNKLDRLAVQIGKAGLVVAVLNLVVLVIRFCVEKFVVERLPWDNAYIQQFVDFVITSITILVIAIPEGLPVAVMVSLAYSVKKMMNDNNLVRHLYACETMGNATAICSDKTGTLTTNRMTVVEVYITGRLNTDFRQGLKLPSAMTSLLTTSIAVNTGYTSQVMIKSSVGGARTTMHVGNKTDCALLGFCLELGVDYEQLRQSIPEQAFRKVYTFNSVRKSMATVVPLKDSGGFHVFVKGASEIVLQRCSWIVAEDGEVTPLDDDRIAALVNDVIKPMANHGLRTLCLAYKDYVTGDVTWSARPGDVVVDVEPDWDDEDKILSRLVCMCIVGIEDPVRPEVPDAIRMCQRAGITVRMVTGDNINTARSIAKKCGILTDDPDLLVIDGAEFNSRIRRSPNDPVDQGLFDAVWPRLRVLARSSPEDKYNLVKGIMSSQVTGASHQQEVVAVTGDGTNDAPALKKADVGFAMGIAGTDIAKEACDIILIDDNFASIVKAVVWGRHVYDSIAKFLQFQLTVNVVAVTLAFIGSCSVRSSPLKAVQMMWVNLLQDTLASLSLATEQPSDSLLTRRPYGRNQSLVSPIMYCNIIAHSSYQLALLLWFLFAGEVFLDVDNGRDDDFNGMPTQHFTFVFNVLVMMTLFNEINARKIDGSPNVFEKLHRSHLFQIIWITSFVLQVIIIQFGGIAFFTVPLTAEQWFWCILFGISELLFGQLLAAVYHVIFLIRRRQNGDVATSRSTLNFNDDVISTSSTTGHHELSTKDKDCLIPAHQSRGYQASSGL